MVKCEICGEEFRLITYSHTKYSHGIDLDEYKLRYPLADIASEEMREAASESSSYVFPSQETVDKRSATMTKNWEDENFREMMVDSQQGRSHTPKHKENLAVSKTRFYSTTEGLECKRLIAEKTKKLWKDPEYVNKQRNSRKLVISENEANLDYILDKYFSGDWEYIGDFQLNIGGRFPDFAYTKGLPLVIELFDSYRHLETARTEDDEIDRITHYRKYGYRCLIIWDWEVSEEYVISKLKEFVGEVY